MTYAPTLWRIRALGLTTALLALSIASRAVAVTGDNSEDDRKFPNAPIDYGYGEGQPIPKKSVFQSLFARNAALAPAATPNGGPDAATKGFFGAPITWPIVAIHQVLLPDGRVFNYGTNTSAAGGGQGAQFVYDIWDPSLGTDASSHLTLPNSTATDIFCGAQSVMPRAFWSTPYDEPGNVLVAGGDLTVGGVRNFANSQTEILNSTTSALRTVKAMQYPRWYPSLVPLRNGDKLIIGGRDKTNNTFVSELYSLSSGWRLLPGVGGPYSEYYYPRAYVGGDGFVYHLTYGGKINRLSLKDNGVSTYAGATMRPGASDFPTAMYQHGKLLSLRGGVNVDMVDISTSTPVVTKGPDADQERHWANLTVLDDGKVLMNGGSVVENQLSGVSLQSQIFNPDTSTWAPAAAATKARLYHSTAMLLPDGTVLTAGGGAPGPVRQYNAEIYYPPYLFKKDGSGDPAPRPVILSATTDAILGDQISLVVDKPDDVRRINLLRSGSVTHSNNLEQRFIPLGFTRSGATITANLSRDPQRLLPGYYMIVVIDKNGVPSVASMLSVQQGVLASTP